MLAPRTAGMERRKENLTRRSGAGKAGNHRNTLAETNDKCIPNCHTANAFFPRNHPVGHIEHAAGEYECDADKNTVIVEPLQQILDRHNQDQRQRGQNDHKEQPRAGIPLPTLAGHRPQVQKSQSLMYHSDNILPINHANGQQSAKMQQYIKKHMSFLGRRQTEQIVQDRQMAGA